MRMRREKNEKKRMQEGGIYQAIKRWAHGVYRSVAGLDRYDVLLHNRSELKRAAATLDSLDELEKNSAVALELRRKVRDKLNETEDELRSYYGWGVVE